MSVAKLGDVGGDGRIYRVDNRNELSWTGLDFTGYN